MDVTTPALRLDIVEPAVDGSGGWAAACAVPEAASEETDELLLGIFRQTRTVAMVGASPNWVRPSYFVMRYLQRKGFRVIPVNPRAVGEPILGETVYPDLASIPVPVDVVDVFRRPTEAPAIAEAAGAIGARALWLQLGIRSPEAGELAVAGGLTFVENRCMKIEYGRLSGELAWCGVNTRLISSRRGGLIR